MDMNDKQIPGSEMPYASEEDRVDALISAGDPQAAKSAPLIRQWEDRRNASEEFCWGFFVKAKKRAAFYLGMQWLLEAESRNDGYMIEPIRPDVDYRVQATFNLFKQHINARRARMLVDHPTPVAEPSNADEGAQEAADVATQFLQYRDFEWDARRNWQKLAAEVATTGLGWILDFWDPSGKAAARDPKTRLVVDLPVGSIVTQLFPGWDVLWDVGTSPTDAFYYIRKEVRTIGDLRKTYPGRGEYVTGSSKEVGDLNARISQINPVEKALSGWLGADASAGSTGPERALKRVTVYQGYEKLGPGSDGYGVWRVVTWCGDVLLDDATAEWQPLTPVLYDELLGNPFPVSMGEDLIEPQERLNKMLSRKHEHFNLQTHPKVLIPGESGVHKGDISNAPGEEVVYYNGAYPRYMEMPSLNAEALAEPGDLARWMGELGGNHEVSQGTLPKSQLSGYAISQLQEKDESNSQHALANFKSALLTHYRNNLKIANKYFDKPHWIAVMGQDQEWDVEEFTGKDIEGVRTVRMSVGTNVPLMPGQKHAFVLNLQERGLFAPGNEEQLRRVMEMLEYGMPQKTLRNAREQAIQTARREQIILQRDGEISPPFELEDHAAHLETHLAFVNSMRFKKLETSLKMGMKQHIETHEGIMTILEAEASQRAQIAQSGGLNTGSIPGEEPGGMPTAGQVPGQGQQ